MHAAEPPSGEQMPVPSSSTPVPHVESVRQRVMASSKRIRRVKLIDRIATWLITSGGVFIIVGVMFIFFFIFREAWPLFRPARGQALGAMTLAPVAPLGTPAAPAGAPAGSLPPSGTPSPAASPTPELKPLLFGIDEYQMYLYQVLNDGRIAFFRAGDGALGKEIPIAGLSGVPLTAASRSPADEFVAAGTADGRVALLQVRFQPKYEGERLADLEIEVLERGVFAADKARWQADREVG